MRIVRSLHIKFYGKARWYKKAVLFISFRSAKTFLPAVIINSNSIQLLTEFDISVRTDRDIGTMFLPFHFWLIYSISLAFQVNEKDLQNKEIKNKKRRIRRKRSTKRNNGVYIANKMKQHPEVKVGSKEMRGGVLLSTLDESGSFYDSRSAILFDTHFAIWSFLLFSTTQQLSA